MEFIVPRSSSTRVPRSFAASAHSEPNGVPAPSHLTLPVQAQLDRIVGSQAFTGAHRSQLFLRYVVEHSFAHPEEPLKEYSIALDVFNRDASYDPAIDAAVRVEAGRLRSRLFEYYAGEGHADPLLIDVPRGGYKAVIRPRQAATASSKRPLAFPGVSSATTPATQSRHFWAIPLAFILGAFLGYRASH